MDVSVRAAQSKRTLKSCAISLTSRWKGSFRMRSSVDFWYRRISRSATVPGRNLWGFFTPPVAACSQNHEQARSQERQSNAQGTWRGEGGVGSDGDTYTREGRLARVLRRELLAWRLAAGGLARGLLNKEIVRNEYARGEREALRVCA